VFRAFAARGLNPVKGEDWDRDKVLDILRANRARHADNQYTQEISRIAASVAAEIAETVDLPAADIATVLLAAGGSVGTVALLRPMTGKSSAEILQFAAVELDNQARRGEPS